MSETFLWVDPDNGQTILDTEWNAEGRFAADPEFESEGVPGQPGERLRAVRHGVHEFTLPFWLHEASEEALRSALRSIIYKMDATRGEGRLRVVAPGGDEREIFCRVATGLGISEVLGQDSGFYAQRITPVFRAYDPYWYAVAETAVVYTGAAEVRTFFPFFPLFLSAAAVFADDTVNNPGDFEAWPVWTISGPASNITVTNLTTGKSFSLTLTLGSAQTLVIDLRPGAKTLLLDDGTSAFSLLTATSSLWALAQGDNNIRVSMDSTSTSSFVRLAFRPRYLSP